ncbi:MAG: sugar kinase, partial [Firmicutes bacterium]|nr:sugar kinase [Bacillota bacterium]
MLGLVGTIPEKHTPLISGTVVFEGDQIILEDERIAVNRGTPAMIAAAAETLKYMDKPNPVSYLVGDIGSGEGCYRLYKHLTDHIADYPFKTLALHYFQPEVSLFKQLLSAIDALEARPTLIADAGFMYVAKMSGDASSFDLFTPDAGELAYLADEKAPHPFYTRGFILHEENLVPDLIERAYLHNNAASYLLVKGATDYIANKSGVIAMIDSPQEEALEAIGGTGDTLTGIVSALIESGMDLKSASINAARVNRLAGSLAKPTPATQVYDIIR